MLERVLEPEYMDTDDEAEGYEAMDHRVPNGSFVDRLLELGSRGDFLDVGCGPGHVPLLICERDEKARVLGVDAAKTMLALAETRRRAAPSAVAERVRFQLVDAKKMPFADASFDAVGSNTVLHHIPDPVPFLRECNRVRRAEGTLLIRDLFRPESEAEISRLVEEHAAHDTPLQRELFAASLRAALRSEELEAAARSAGLTDFEVIIDSDRHHSLQIKAQ